MYVIKRDGSKASVSFDKITSRITKLCYGLDPKVRKMEPPFIASAVQMLMICERTAWIHRSIILNGRKHVHLWYVKNDADSEHMFFMFLSDSKLLSYPVVRRSSSNCTKGYSGSISWSYHCGAWWACSTDCCVIRYPASWLLYPCSSYLCIQLAQNDLQIFLRYCKDTLRLCTPKDQSPSSFDFDSGIWMCYEE